MSIDYETFYCSHCNKVKKIELIVEELGKKPVCSNCHKNIKEHKAFGQKKRGSRKLLQNNKLSDFDETAVYVTTNTICRQTGRSKTSIVADINKGYLKALVYRKSYHVHPDDAEVYINERLQENKLFG